MSLTHYFFVLSIQMNILLCEIEAFALKSADLKSNGYTFFHFTESRLNLFHSVELRKYDSRCSNLKKVTVLKEIQKEIEDPVQSCKTDLLK